MMMASPAGRSFFDQDPRPLTSLSSEGDFSLSRRVSTTASDRDERNRCKPLLPEGFEPTPYSVICGRGRKCTAAVGNRRLQVIATMFIGRYAQLNRKEEKSEIVSEILSMVKDACPDERYAFIKYHGGRWWEVETLIAREKIGAVLRDCLHSKYRSSTKSKLERRRAAKKLQGEHEDTLTQDFGEALPLSRDVQSSPSVDLTGM